MIWRVFAVCILAVTYGTQAHAQSKAELALKVERLEREMIALENRLRGGGAQAGGVQASGAVTDRALLADIAAKIGTVERSLRTLTGRLEELEYKQRQTDSAIELLRKELMLQQQEASDFRASQASQEASQVATSGPSTALETPPVATEPKEPEIALPEGDAAAQYQYAFSFIQKNELDKGFRAMEMFLTANPEGQLAGNAKFWLGRIHLLEKRMPQAAQQLLALIEEHPNHAKRVDALLDLADVLIALDSKPDACDALAEFRRSDAKASERLKARAQRTAAEAGCDY
ncbi:MAG: tetratricopeptide repeat protein [Alphaproteobacteria bacterium]|nr:tetratricopeptide repeat protein [Alphaproteobacteria bacterium]